MVIVASRNLENCEKFAREMRKKNLKAYGCKLDLSEKNSIIALRNEIVKRFGKTDILVNNAVARIGKSFERMTEEDWELTSRINSTGLFLCSRIFIEQMKKQKSGNIINIASIYGIVGPDFNIYNKVNLVNPPDYSFNKGGMINFTRYMATCFARHNIRVNCISPGGFYTGQEKSFHKEYCRRTPLGRMATKNDIKGAIVFLTSDASSYITGINLPVDGGWTAW